MKRLARLIEVLVIMNTDQMKQDVYVYVIATDIFRESLRNCSHNRKNTEYPGGDTCIIFHKHKASHPYHQHGKARNLRQAVRKIKGHDVFQMNGRKHSQ